MTGLEETGWERHRGRGGDEQDEREGRSKAGADSWQDKSWEERRGRSLEERDRRAAGQVPGSLDGRSERRHGRGQAVQLFGGEEGIGSKARDGEGVRSVDDGPQSS